MDNIIIGPYRNQTELMNLLVNWPVFIYRIDLETPYYLYQILYRGLYCYNLCADQAY